MLDTETIKHTLGTLTYENHQTWFDKLSGLLTFISLSDHISNLENESQHDEEWTKKDQEIVKLMFDSADERLKIHILDVKTAIDCWQKLRSACENRKSLNEIVASLCNYKLNLNSCTELEISIDQFSFLCDQALEYALVLGDSRFRASALINMAIQQKAGDPTSDDFESIKSQLLKNFNSSIQQDNNTSVTENQDANKLNSEKVKETIANDLDDGFEAPEEYENATMLLDSTNMNPNSMCSQEIQDIRFMKTEPIADVDTTSKQTQHTKSITGKQDLTCEQLGFLYRKDRDTKTSPRKRNEKRDDKRGSSSRRVESTRTKHNRNRNSNSDSFKRKDYQLADSNENQSSFDPLTHLSPAHFVNMELFKKLTFYEKIEDCHRALKDEMMRQSNERFYVSN